jgi:hypothetical protein
VTECEEQEEKHKEKIEDIQRESHNLYCNNMQQISDLQNENNRLSELVKSRCSENTKLEEKVNCIEEDYKTELENKKYLLGRAIKLYDVITEQQNVLSVYTKINSEVRESYAEALLEVKKVLLEISEKNIEKPVEKISPSLMLASLEDFDNDEFDDVFEYDNIKLGHERFLQPNAESEEWQTELITELTSSQPSDVGKEECKGIEQEEKSIVVSFMEKINDLKNKFI